MNLQSILEDYVNLHHKGPAYLKELQTNAAKAGTLGIVGEDRIAVYAIFATNFSHYFGVGPRPHYMPEEWADINPEDFRVKASGFSAKAGQHVAKICGKGWRECRHLRGQYKQLLSQYIDGKSTAELARET